MPDNEFKVGDKVMLLPTPDRLVTRTTVLLANLVGTVTKNLFKKHDSEGGYVEVGFKINNELRVYYIAKNKLKHASHHVNVMEDGG